MTSADALPDRHRPAAAARQAPMRWHVLAAAAGLVAVLAIAAQRAASAPSPSAPSPSEARPASPAEMAASLARGQAWIWPGSNGPPWPAQAAAPYRGAAVLLASLRIRQQHLEASARQAPFAAPTGVRVMPVLHVEAADDAPDTLTPAQQQGIVAAARQLAPAAAASGWLQLDFEAPARQRQTYVQLVAALREALPDGVRLSVTALAHWCSQGDWLDRLRADEVVPMLYRLGPDAARWRQRFLAPEASALARRCRGPALGFATNDPPPAALLRRTARPYWFDEAAWTNPARPPAHLLPP